MYCMTGRWPEGTGSEQGATASKRPSWLGAWLRRFRRTGSGEDAAADSATAAADSATPATGSGAVTAAADSATATATAIADTPGAADDSARSASPGGQVPRLLQLSAAWAWRLLLVGLIIYLAFRLAVALRLVTLPFIAAMLLTALLQPSTAMLRHRGMSPLLATWCTFLLAIVVIAGAFTLLGNRISADYPVLFSELRKTSREVQHSLAGAPFHLSPTRLSMISSDVLNYISQHKSVVAGTVLTGGKYAAEILAGVVLTLFITFFLLKDGAQIWKWLIKGLSPEANRRMANAGNSSWRALVNYMRGTTLVAAIHALLLGLALWLLGVPLLVPLIVLVFLAAFVPLIGILVAGGLAILITLGTKGLVAAVILLAVLLVENQIEGHLLQPLVVGRIVKLHPLAIILALAVGGIIAGIPGAIIAVPTAAVITYAWPELRGRPPDA
jgi:predicted PurR-regulated permease PerM